MATSKIGTRGPNKGPAKTSMAGSFKGGNLGRTTKQSRNTGTNKDPVKGIQNARINPGPGGSQRP